jgi:hypothetical protein
LGLCDDSKGYNNLRENQIIFVSKRNTTVATISAGIPSWTSWIRILIPNADSDPDPDDH